MLNKLNLDTIVPKTFHIKTKNDDEYRSFVKFFNECEKSIEDSKEKNLWIVKPGEYSNRGKGITVCSEIDEVDEILNNVHKQEKLRNG